MLIMEGKMALLSTLPGRIRFESKHLIGKLHICRQMQEHIKNYEIGITEVTVNHRTGRILVKFDEKQVDRRALVQYISRVIKEYRGKITKDCLPIKTKRPKLPITEIVNHTLVEMVAHAFFPKPFNFLVPIAMKAVIGRS